MGYHLITLWLHYKRKKERRQVFFKFFFSVGVGAACVGAWVWVRGCGCVGRRDMDWAGWMEAGYGLGGLDSSPGLDARV